MRNAFKKAILTETEQTLQSWGVKYTVQKDGLILVPGDLNICNMGLTKLPNLSSVTVGGSFACAYNQLIALEGAPKTVGGDFWCSYNRLTTLEHAPQSVGGVFYCHDNKLISLEGSPAAFKKIKSDFGEFSAWDAVPENLRVSPQTKARRAQEAILAATVLQEKIKVSPPLSFRK